MKTPYEQIGGEAAVRLLVDRFYGLMDTLPEAKTIRALHATDLTSAKNKLFMFLSGWMGGPPLYTDQFGHPRLRARHLPFPIGKSERDAWMLCMRKAMEEVISDPKVRASLEQAFFRTADFMRNELESNSPENFAS
jgi:hemoglobin